MSPRTAGVVFLVAAALFAFIYLYEIRGEEGRREAEEAEKRLFPDIEVDAVEELSFSPAGGEPVRLERADGRWQLREPLEFPADAFAADGMASALADLTRQQVLDDPQPPETYGLGEGALEIAFRAGGAEHRVRIGDAAPVGSNTYVAVDQDPAVYTVASFGVNALRKDLGDLRDKRVAHFDQAAVDRIEARWPDGGVTLAKGEGGWRLLSPVEDAADTATVDALLTDLNFLRATGFEDAPPPDADAGLDPPDFAVTLGGSTSAEEGEAEPLELRIAVGRAQESDERLVRAAAASLYRIPADRIADFPREVVAYRFKELSRYPQADAARVEVVFARLVSSEEGDEPVEVVATRGDSGWSTGPGGFAPGKVASLVSELSRLRAVDILAEAPDPERLADWGLAPPRTEISVYGEGDALLGRVQIGVVRADGSIVARAGDGGRVYALDAEVAEYLPVGLEAFRNRFEAEEASAPEPAGGEESSGAEETLTLEEEPFFPPEEPQR